MLEFIRIQRFKTLLDASFPLSSLNLFCGLNGMGKSSLIQALLLLRQSFERNTLFEKGLLLKGDYVTLGTGKDVLAEDAEEDSIEMILTWTEKAPIKLNYKYIDDSDFQSISNAVEFEGPEKISLFNQNFQYLSAERIGPKTSYKTSDYHIRDLNSLGNFGEYTAHYIAKNGSNSLPNSQLKHVKAKSSTLLENLNHWMSELTPGLRIHAVMQPDIDSVSLSYSFEQGRETTAHFKPQNVGFGLTYVLPVVVAILRAKAGDMLIIENPESHLHPAGQAVMGRLCVLAAQNDVQLFIETHSDHFLNGVRVALKDRIVDPEDVKVFYLERDKEGKQHSSIVKSPEIDENGRLDFWPEGFFDEWDKQLEKLL